MLPVMKITLTKKQKQALESQHGKTRDGRVRDRIKAVLLASEGWSTPMISQALRIHQTTVLHHLSSYQESEKLKPGNGGSECHLSDAKTQQLIEHISDYTYAHTYQIVVYI